MLTKETEAVWQGGAFAPYKRFAKGKTLAEAEFISAEHFDFPRNPKGRGHPLGCPLPFGATDVTRTHDLLITKYNPT